MRTEDVQKILHTLMLCADKLDRSQVKQLFRILISVGRFPVCVACHQPITDIRDFSWDHIWPASKGGSNELVNMQPMHCACNVAKGCEIQPQYIKYEAELIISAETDAPALQQKPKKYKNTKKRNIQRFTPSQIAELGFKQKNKRMH